MIAWYYINLPLAKYPRKSTLFLDGLHRCSKMRILASVAVLIKCWYLSNSIKKSKFRPSRACCAIWEWIKQSLQNSFQLEAECFRRKSWFSFPRNNEELQQFKFTLSDDIRNYSWRVVNIHFRQKFGNDIKQESKEWTTLTAIFGAWSHSPKMLLLNLTLLGW